jgi:hypothetical protein
MKKGKKAQMWETLIPWIIGAIVLVVVVILFIVLTGKGQAALTYLKNIVRFGK